MRSGRAGGGSCKGSSAAARRVTNPGANSLTAETWCATVRCTVDQAGRMLSPAHGPGWTGAQLDAGAEGERASGRWVVGAGARSAESGLWGVPVGCVGSGAWQGDPWCVGSGKLREADPQAIRASSVCMDPPAPAPASECRQPPSTKYRLR